MTRNTDFDRISWLGSIKILYMLGNNRQDKKS